MNYLYRIVRKRDKAVVFNSQIPAPNKQEARGNGKERLRLLRLSSVNHIVRIRKYY